MFNQLIDSISAKNSQRISFRSTIFLLFSVVICSSSASAEGLTGQVVLPIQKFLKNSENQISKLNPYINEVKQIQLSVNGLPLAVDQFQYQISWRTHNLQINSQSQVTASFDDLVSRVHINELKINGYIKKVINGVTLNLLVKTTCQNINAQLSIPKLKMKGFFENKGQINKPVELAASLTDVLAESSQVQVDDIKCDLIQGVEEEITQEIKNFIDQNQFYQKQLLDILNIKIHEQLVKTNQAILEKLISQNNIYNLDLNLIQNSIIKIKKIDDQFIQIVFGFNLSSEQVAAFDQRIFDFNAESVIKSKSDLVFIVSQKSFEKIMTEKMNKKLFATQYTSKDISALDDLTKSRFKQFFVWPALMKRKKGKELSLRPQVTDLKINLPVNSISQSIALNLKTGLWVLDDDIKMVYFQNSFGIESMKNQQSFWILELTQLITGYIWDPTYLVNKTYSKRISTKIINTAVAAFFTNRWAKENFTGFFISSDKKIELLGFMTDSHENFYSFFNLEQVR